MMLSQHTIPRPWRGFPRWLLNTSRSYKYVEVFRSWVRYSSSSHGGPMRGSGWVVKHSTGAFTMQPKGYSNPEYILQSPLICTFFACILYGVICTQTFAYMHRFPKDSKIIKSTVLLLCLLEGCHLGLLMNVLNYYVIQRGGEEASLQLIYTGVGICYIFGYVCTYLVNLFYVWRMWIISKRSAFSVIIAILATARVAVEIAFCTLSMFNNEWNLFTQNLRPTFVSTLVLTAVVDCWIALSMTYYLHQGRTSITMTDSVISRCVRYTVGTGALTFMMTVVILVTMFTGPSITFLCLVPVQCKRTSFDMIFPRHYRDNRGISAVYSNSLLVSLNSRNPKRSRDIMSSFNSPETPSDSTFSRVDLIPPNTPRWHWRTGDFCEPVTPSTPHDI
ncbi:hypothetical protein BJ138DRAFT_1159981 [Hygrophoropsis aurantiaca]|uniref:Uncharacterized protein n=1 Tax=Hygrophoropsis aurantiaca TaxID=72124 RepID=A0ACB8A2T7_9AGAM|nr:hypothetical protein BJ138DRAFT_1159981 [Hygrophoropsis aurantiaca]